MHQSSHSISSHRLLCIPERKQFWCKICLACLINETWKLGKDGQEEVS